ncbi:MAG: hypothetical protein ABSB35_35140 [Bryobacteraceae bacterium]
MSAEPNIIHLTEERFAELARAAAAQSKSPDELADEAIAMLLCKRRLDELMQFGQRHTRDLGIPENDIERLISEVRSERRTRAR